jgi:hypothetical protein
MAGGAPVQRQTGHSVIGWGDQFPGLIDRWRRPAGRPRRAVSRSAVVDLGRTSRTELVTADGAAQQADTRDLGLGAGPYVPDRIAGGYRLLAGAPTLSSKPATKSGAGLQDSTSRRRWPHRSRPRRPGRHAAHRTRVHRPSWPAPPPPRGVHARSSSVGGTVRFSALGRGATSVAAGRRASQSLPAAVPPFVGHSPVGCWEHSRPIMTSG